MWAPETPAREEPEEPSSQGSIGSVQEASPACEPVGPGKPGPDDLISCQPQSATNFSRTLSSSNRRETQKPTCPSCGLAVPDQPRPPASPHLPRRQPSSLSMNRSRSSVVGSQQLTDVPGDWCFHLLLACLSCHCSVMLLGLLEAGGACCDSLCSCCCHAGTRCCSSVLEVPMEELNCGVHCHSVLFESCCEPTECLEFCLECCQICHRS